MEGGELALCCSGNKRALGVAPSWLKSLVPSAAFRKLNIHTKLYAFMDFCSHLPLSEGAKSWEHACASLWNDL